MVPSKEKLKKRVPFAVRLIVAVSCVLLLLLLFGLVIFRAYISKINIDSSEEGNLNPSGVTNILLIGVDNDNAAGWGERGNADGLMIVSINEDRRRIVLTSLMRDIRVQIPDSYHTKLTLVYHDGGVPVLIDTIEQNFGVEIDAYVLVNYLSVIQVVDAVGGLDMELTADEVYYMDAKIQNLCYLTGADYEENRITQMQGGILHLNGLQAAAFLRVRYAGNGDFDRTERARNVLLAIRDKAAENGIRGINDLLDAALPCIHTNMSGRTITALSLRAPTFMGYETRSERIPTDGSWWYSNEAYGSFVDIVFETNRWALWQNIYE